MCLFSGPRPDKIITEKSALRQRQVPAVDYPEDLFQFSFTCGIWLWSIGSMMCRNFSGN